MGQCFDQQLKAQSAGIVLPIAWHFEVAVSV